MPTPNSKEHILVVDDSRDTREVISRNLCAQGFSVLTAPDVSEAVGVLESKHVDLVITDLKMPKASGLDLIRHVRENFGKTEIMMITGYSSIEGAVEAVKKGADEYLPKPFTDEELLSAVRRSLDKLRLRNSGQGIAKKKANVQHGLVGESIAINKVFNAIEKAASTTATVLITGESGTGKELVARAIHYASKRSPAPFVPINCGSIPETLLESELFGYKKGAFTGATETRAGFFQTADGGTVFLDEISNTSLSVQAKLLRVLEDKEVYMVGANRSQKVDVRIVAATNKSMNSLIEKEAFREDLFYRLNVITIEIAPLRERDDDILVLAHHFAAKYADELDQAVPGFADDALKLLRGYYWPGNVRELENVIHRIVVMTDKKSIEAADFPSLMRFSAPRRSGTSRSLIEVENEHIRNVLATVDGNKTLAAKILGITRKTLRQKLTAFTPFTRKNTSE